MLIKYFVPVALVMCQLSCVDNSNKNQAIDSSVEKEISERITKIKALSLQNDTVFVDPDKVDKRIRELILLSKDIENLNACANLSNQYFLELSKTHGINVTEFQKLNTGMHINDMATALKQNEMLFFNHILLKTGIEAIPIHSAR